MALMLLRSAAGTARGGLAARQMLALAAPVAPRVPPRAMLRAAARDQLQLLHRGGVFASPAPSQYFSSAAAPGPTPPSADGAAATATATPAQPAPAASLFRDQNDTWVDRHAPEWAQPYLKLTRIDRPIGTWLVLLPGLWGLALAAPPGGLPDPGYVALFTAGAFLMRSAGCTINDIWDRDFDGRVARTAQRPLAAGRLGLLQAWTFLGAQLAAGLGVLLQFNGPTIAAGSAIVPVVVGYPLLKRVTHWPQAVLGVAMNYGVVMGWVAVHGAGPLLQLWQGGGGAAAAALDPSQTAWLPLYGGAIAWTIVYDTIYAHQDKADDARLGLRSTALLMGGRSRAILTGFALLAGGAWAAAGAAAGLAWPYAAAVAGATGHMLWQVNTADYGDRLSLARRFVSNAWVGWAVLAGLVAGRLLQEQEREEEEEQGAAAPPKPAVLA